MSTTYRTLRRAVDDLVAAEDVITAARQKHHDAQITLGRALHACRIHKGLSLRKVARLLKTSASYLSDVERGTRGISDGNLEVLMGIIGPPSFSDIIEIIQDATKNAHKSDFLIGKKRA